MDQEEVNQIVKEYLDYTKNPQTSSDKKEFEFLSERCIAHGICHGKNR